MQTEPNPKRWYLLCSQPQQGSFDPCLTFPFVTELAGPAGFPPTPGPHFTKIFRRDVRPLKAVALSWVTSICYVEGRYPRGDCHTPEVRGTIFSAAFSVKL